MSYNIRTTLDVQDNLNIGLNANISGSLSVTGSINGNLNGTATSASYVLNAVSSSRAISASYALNGGVTQLLAGPNVTLSPTNGLGQVTVSATLSGSTSFNTATGSYGSFYDTTIQTNPVANIPRSMSFDSTDITNGVSISGSTSPFNTYIKTENAGIYNIQFSAQVDKTDSGTDEIVIWLRKNGIDLTDTATTITLNGNNDKQVAAWNWFVTSAANDYYQIIWYSADTAVRLLAEIAGGGHPGIPSVILTVNRVDQFLSNTGSFSGSFTGQFTGSLFGTSSWAQNALTSSFITSTGTNAFIQNGNSFGTQALLGTNDNNNLAFETSGSVRMFISSSGNVGIGTTSSLERLRIQGDGTNSSIGIYDNTGVVKFRVGSGTGAPELFLSTIGNININSKFQSLAQNAIEISNQGLTLSNITNANQGVIGISGFTFAPAAGSGSFRPINVSYTINASGAQVGSVTGILVNAIETSLSGSTHNLMDLQISGSSRFSVNNTSTIITGSLLITGSSITIGSTTISPTATSTFTGVGSDIYTTYGSQNKPITLRFRTGTTPSTLSSGIIIENALSSNIVTNQTGSFGILNLTSVGFSPTAGGADFYGINLSNTINSQGSGSIKSIYYNPTITRITGSHRFIESTAGDVLIQSGSYPLFFITGSGRVGIGTSAPVYDLDILTPSGDTNYLRIAGNGVSNTNGNITLGNLTGTAGVFAPLLSSKSSNLSYPGMYFIGDGASGTDSGTTPMIRFDGRINNGAVSTRPLIGFSNVGVDLVTVLANGNVGIGALTPSTKLQVRGASSGSGTTAFRVENSNASASLTITDFGTVTTGGPLVIGNTAANPVNGSAIIQSTYGNHAGQFEIRPNNLSSLIYFSNGGSGGGMYLGTSKYFSTPYSVYASGSVIVGDYSSFANNTAAPARFAVSGSNNQTLVNIESPGSSSIFNVNGSGNVGIGTSTPDVKLKVFGTGEVMRIGNDASADAYITFANRGGFGLDAATGLRFQGTNTRPIIFAINSTWGTGEIARFSTQGFFGLNTNIPSAWLHISGTVASSSLFRIDAPGSASIFEVSGSGVVTINGAIPVTRNVTGYNVTRFTNSASFDNIRVAISSSGNPVASSVSGSVNVFYSAVSSVAGSAISSSVNTGAIFTTGSWSVLTSATLGSGGDTITSHIQDQDRGRLYRATFIQTAGPASGSVVIERLI
jgi:hypothetical protein